MEEVITATAEVDGIFGFIVVVGFIIYVNRGLIEAKFKEFKEKK